MAKKGGRRNGHMRRHGAQYYVRRKVPKDIVAVIGKTEFVVPLGTGDADVARVRRDAEMVRINAEFERARRLLRAGPVTRVSDADVATMVVGWLDQYDRERSASAGIATSREEHREALHDVSFREGSLLDPEDPTAESYIYEVASKVLRDNNVSMSVPSREYSLLCDLVRRALVEATRREGDRLLGDHSGRSHDRLFRARARGHDPHTATLYELIEMFNNDPERTHLRGKTRADYGMTFRALRELWGDNKLIADVNRADCRRVKELFAVLPSNATKKFPGMTLSRAAEEAVRKRVEPMNPKTANAHLSRVSTFLRWAEREEYIDRNPAVGLRVAAIKSGGREARDPFSVEQLRAIFNAPLYTGCRDDEHGYDVPGTRRPRRGRFWVPLLALHTGMRLSECCQLTVDDLAVRDGVDVIIVRSGEGQRLKTEAAHRVIPVHPELRKIGFLAFVTEARERGQERLFPELRQDRRGYYSGHFQRWFARFLEKCAAKGPKTTFHSFRHNFRDALREADIGRDAVLALGGWSAGGTEEIYGGGLRPSTLADEIAKVKYPGLDLTRLHLTASQH